MLQTSVIKIFITVGLAVAIVNTAVAQQTERLYFNQVKLSPFRFIDPVFSGVELAYQRRHGQLASQVSIGKFFTTVLNSAYNNYDGYRIGAEERYFFKNKHDQERYLSLELVHQFNSFSGSFRFTHDSTTTSPSFLYNDSITIRRSISIINFKFGKEVFLGRFVFDFSIGLGLRIRNVAHEDKLYPGDKMLFPRHPNIHYHANAEKNDVALNMPYNIRVGFIF